MFHDDRLNKFFKSLLVRSLVVVPAGYPGFGLPKFLNLVSGLHMLDNSSVKQVCLVYWLSYLAV